MTEIERQVLLNMLSSLEAQASALRSALSLPQTTSSNNKTLWLIQTGKYTAAEAVGSTWIQVGDSRKIDCIKTMRELLQLGLKEAKELVESAPCKIGAFEPTNKYVLELVKQGCVLEWR